MRIKHYLLFCMLITSFMLHADEISEYHDRVIKAFAGKDNLTMVLGAGDALTDYQRFKDYTFLVNGEDKGAEAASLAALNAYRNSKLKSLSEIDVSQTPLPLILNFNNPEFLHFLARMPGKFSKIIFDLSVTKFLPDKIEPSWFAGVCKALNNDGLLIMNLEVGGIPSTTISELQKTLEQITEEQITEVYKSTFVEKDEYVRFSIGSLTLRLPGTNQYQEVIVKAKTQAQNNELSVQDKEKLQALLDRLPGNKDFMSEEARFNLLNSYFEDANEARKNRNIAIMKQAGFEFVELKKGEYPIRHPHFQEDTYYVAYKKDFLKEYDQKLIKSLEQRNDLTMVLGAGEQASDYQRFPDYTFLVNNVALEYSLKAWNEHQRTINPDHKDAKSVAQISKTPLPLKLDFNEVEFWRFLERFPKKFSKIILDHDVSSKLHAFSGGTFQEEWFKKIAQALNDDGQFIMDLGHSVPLMTIGAFKRSDFAHVAVHKNTQYPVSPRGKADFSKANFVIAYKTHPTKTNHVAQLITPLQTLKNSLTQLSEALTKLPKAKT